MTLRTQNIVITVINVLLAALLIYIIVQPGKKAKEIEVKIATVVDPASLPFWVAEEKGFFKEVGINYKPNEVDRVTDELESTISGALYSSFGMDFTLMLMKTGGDMKFVRLLYYTEDEGDGIIVKDTSIKSLEDLKNKRIGYNSNTRHNVILENLLTSDTVRPEFIGLSPDEMDASLDVGRVDAIYVTEPYLTYLKNKGYTVLAENVAFKGKIIEGVGLTSQVNVSLRRDAINRIRKAIEEAIEYINRNPDEAKRILAKHVGMSLPLPKYVPASESSVGDIKNFAEDIKSRNLIPLRKLDLEGLLEKK